MNRFLHLSNINMLAIMKHSCAVMNFFFFYFKCLVFGFCKRNVKGNNKVIQRNHVYVLFYVLVIYLDI